MTFILLFYISSNIFLHLHIYSNLPTHEYLFTLVVFNEQHLTVSMEIRTLVRLCENEINLIVIRTLTQERNSEK